MKACEVPFNPPTVEVGNRRLLKLADVLETVPKERFDYGSWVGDTWQGAANLSCGTTACALGWATTIPSFRKLGLCLNEGGVPTLAIDRLNDDTYDCDQRAANHIFHLNANEFFRLFIPSDGENNATPKQVAKKIRKFVKERTTV